MLRGVRRRDLRLACTLATSLAAGACAAWNWVRPSDERRGARFARDVLPELVLTSCQCTVTIPSPSLYPAPHASFPPHGITRACTQMCTSQKTYFQQLQAMNSSKVSTHTSLLLSTGGNWQRADSSSCPSWPLSHGLCLHSASATDHAVRTAVHRRAQSCLTRAAARCEAGRALLATIIGLRQRERDLQTLSGATAKHTGHEHRMSATRSRDGISIERTAEGHDARESAPIESLCKRY